MEEISTPIEFDFPVTDFYKGHILDGQTLSRTGVWWTAILLIEEPKTKKPFIGLYRWQKTQAGWKVRKRFSFHRVKEVSQVIEIIQKFSLKLEKHSEASEE